PLQRWPRCGRSLTGMMSRLRVTCGTGRGIFNTCTSSEHIRKTRFPACSTSSQGTEDLRSTLCEDDFFRGSRVGPCHLAKPLIQVQFLANHLPSAAMYIARYIAFWRCGA